MSQARRSDPPAEPDQRAAATMRGFALLMARTTSWLYEVGTWKFGGLIGFSLLLVSALLTVGPIDTAILVSVTTLGCALPLDIAAISVLRLAKDSREVGMWMDELALQSLKDAGFPDIESYFPPASEREDQRHRREFVTIAFAAGIAPLSFALSLTGLVAALWYMAWWIGVAVLIVAVVSAVLVVLALVHAQPPESPAQKEQWRRYSESRRWQRQGGH